MCYCYLLGNLLLYTAGEVHLEKCIKDLKTRFVKVEFTVSPPVSGTGAFPRDYRVHSVAGCIRGSGGRRSVRHSLCSIEFGRDR